MVTTAATNQEQTWKSHFCSSDPIVIKAKQAPREIRNRNTPTYKNNLKSALEIGFYLVGAWLDKV